MAIAGELRAAYRAWAEEAVAAARVLLGDALVGAVLFGSVARGTPHPGSDIDLLLVVADLPAGRAARRDLAGRIEERARGHNPDMPDLSLVARTPQEVAAGFPLLLDMIEDGVILLDTADRVAKLLADWKVRLAAQGARRMVTGETWHWDLAGTAGSKGWRL